jgi:hypothetical protein
VTAAGLSHELNHIAIAVPPMRARSTGISSTPRTRSLCDRRYAWAARPGEPITCDICRELYQEIEMRAFLAWVDAEAMRAARAAAIAVVDGVSPLPAAPPVSSSDDKAGP